MKDHDVLRRCAELSLTVIDDAPSVFPLLAEAPRPPRRLFLRGDAAALAGPGVAVVGTRRPSPYGLRAASVLARDLARAGAVVVSGLARGIDAAAHRGAMAAGGVTVAVLGHGLDRVYPPEHRELADEIVAGGGCLVSEYAPDVPPLRHHFPERNRIIAGLSLGTVVVEAAEKSGALLTARDAMEANREVFAVPGPFDDPGFAGGHRLLQEGAKLVAGVDDVLGELEPFAGVVSAAGRPPALDASMEPLARAFAALGGSATLEDLFAGMRLTLAEIARSLEVALERGFVDEIDAQRFVWIGAPARR